MFVCTNTQLNTAALRTCWGVYLQNSICLCNFLNLDRYCFKYVVTHCLLHISYLGNSAEKNNISQAGKQESRERHLSSSRCHLLFALCLLLKKAPLHWLILTLLHAGRFLCSSRAWASKHFPYNTEQTCQLPSNCRNLITLGFPSLLL